MKSFWDGFEKQAAAATKGIRSGMGIISNRAGLSIGAKPRAGVAVASQFKPNKIPSPSLNAAASKNLQPSLIRDLGQTIAKKPGEAGRGVGNVKI